MQWSFMTNMWIHLLLNFTILLPQKVFFLFRKPSELISLKLVYISNLINIQSILMIETPKYLERQSRYLRVILRQLYVTHIGEPSIMTCERLIACMHSRSASLAALAAVQLMLKSPHHHWCLVKHGIVKGQFINKCAPITVWWEVYSSSSKRLLSAFQLASWFSNEDIQIKYS